MNIMQMLGYTLSQGFLQVLGQLPSKALEGEPRLTSETSATLTILMGIILVAGILAVAFRPAKRDRVDEV
jgi:hypothetical protein